MNELQVKLDQQPIDHMDYRGFSVDFFEDPYGKQLYTLLNGNRLDFGADNTMYKDDLKMVIDSQLDTITRFSRHVEFSGARLTWFNNGGFRDIKLIHWNRILKIYLVADPEKVNLKALEKDAEGILDRLIEKEK